ncbi:MAG: hypothetical protein E6767_14375 [Dysgonomonas sp.]|nr:hypothetical protein [Dysgonomonas sp.]
MTLLNKIQSDKKSQFWLFFIVLVLLTLFMMVCNGPTLTYSGYDFYFHYRRLHTLIEALQEGTYPFYIDYSNVDGYGYFTKGFYSDVILIPFAVIGIFTSTYFAYDVMLFTMTILCGVFMYHTVNVIYKNRYAASVSAILYTFAVYRLYDIYQRGALAEGLSFTFLPIVFLGIYHIIKSDYRKWYILAIGYSLLIYTHAIASVLMFVTLLILLIVYYKAIFKEPKRLLYLCVAGAITLIIVSSYVIPTIEQLASNSFYLDSRRPGGGAGYGKVGFDLILWGFVSGIAYPDMLWTGAGIILMSIILLRFFVKKNEKGESLKSIDIGVLIGLFFIVATSRIFPWGRFPFSILGFIQYPWRLYEFVSFFFAVAGGYYLSVIFIKSRARFIAGSILIALTMLTVYIHSENFKFLYNNKALQIYDGSSNEIPSFENRYHAIGGEYFPSRLPAIEYIRDRGEIVESLNNGSKIENLKREQNITTFSVEVNKKDSLVLPLLYYYGYTATLNGRTIPVTQSEFGLAQIPVDESGKVEAYYKGTTLQWISIYLSLAGILALCIYIIAIRKRKNDE